MQNTVIEHKRVLSILDAGVNIGFGMFLDLFKAQFPVEINQQHMSWTNVWDVNHIIPIMNCNFFPELIHEQL
jgi:hypothetical protein